MNSGNGWISRLARRTVRGLARVYYPSIEISGANHLPADGPLLLTANHQNSLMDPVMVGLVAKRPVRFLAKAPLFQIPVFGNILHALGMMPAYRRSDDPSQTHRNLESLGFAAGRLRLGEAVGIFPEGKSHDATRVEQVKSGAARIAIQAVREGTANLKLVPLGINYRRKEQFRSAVWVRVGEPIDVSAWLDGRSGDDRQAARDLTAEIDRRLKELVVHLDEEAWAPFLDHLETLLPPPRASRRNPFAWLRQRKHRADAIHHFMRTDRARAEATARVIQETRDTLQSAGLTARSTVLRWHGWRLTARLVGEALLMNVGFFVVLIGTLHHLLPFLLTRAIASRVQAPGRSTIALARFGAGIPIYGAWYAFHAWWITNYFLPWVAWAWLLPMPFAGLLALQYWRRVKRTSPAWWRDLAIAFQPAKLRELRRAHGKLRETLETMAEEFAQVHPAERLPVNSFSWRRFGWATARWTTVGLAVVFAVAWFRTMVLDDSIGELGKPPPRLSQLTTNDLAGFIASDEQMLVSAISSARALEVRAAELQAGFLSGKRSYYAQADSDAIRQAMLSYLSCRTTLLGLVWKYQRHAEIADERLRARAFLLQLAAASAISDSSLKLVTRFEPYADTVRKLNEPDASWGLPPGMFDLVKRNLMQTQARDFMNQSLDDYRAAAATFARFDLVAAAPFNGFHDVIRQHAQTREERLSLLAEGSLTEPIKEAGRMTKTLTYHGQAFVSTWLGSTRFRQPRDGQLMIRPQELAEFRAKLKPGDILIERQNWFLSRALMPGYWAHAALYVGTTNDLVRLGLDRDPRVVAQWRQFAARNAQGHEHLILEAVPEGVRMTTLEHCIGVADAAAVLRPRVKEENVREAIARAFSHLGKNYDFDFDFFSSDKLVCTELVFRCYDGAVQFPLVEVMGRKTLPPTELVRKFVKERGQAKAQLDCVCFLDGDERVGKASFRTEETFITTLERPGLILFPSSAAK